MLEAQRSGAPFLAFRNQEGSLRLEVLGPERREVTIGRGRAMDLRLPWDEEVSGVHAELTRRGQDWIVVDDGLSKNGTYVNDDRVIGQRRLRHGDRIRCGRTLLAFHGADDAEPIGATKTAGDAPVLRPPSGDEMCVLIALCRPFKTGAELARTPGNRAIADELHWSESTVKNHLRRLSKEFGVDDLPPGGRREALAKKAMRLGIVVPRDL